MKVLGTHFYLQIVSALGLALAGACEGEKTPQVKPYEVQFQARDTSGDPVPSVEIRDENSDVVVARTDSTGQVRLGAVGLPGSRLSFRVRPPADYKLVDQGEQREVLLRPNSAQQPVILHEIGLRPLKLTYVLLVDSEIPFCEVLVNGDALGKLNSQGGGAFLYSGVPETAVTLRAVPPESYWEDMAKGATGTAARNSAESTQADPRTAFAMKLSDRLEDRIIYFRSTLPAPPVPVPLKKPETRHRLMHVPVDISPSR